MLLSLLQVGVINEHIWIGNISSPVITYGDVFLSPQQGWKVILALTDETTSYVLHVSSQDGQRPLNPIVASLSLLVGIVVEQIKNPSLASSLVTTYGDVFLSPQQGVNVITLSSLEYTAYSKQSTTQVSSQTPILISTSLTENGSVPQTVIVCNPFIVPLIPLPSQSL